CARRIRSERPQVKKRPRILALAAAQPSYDYSQATILASAQDALLGPRWRDDPQARESGRQIAHLFAATRVERRQSVLDLPAYYGSPRTTGERMATYREAAHALGRAAMEAALCRMRGRRTAADVTDFTVVSCTGYSAPGLDITVACDLGFPRDTRRMVIG